MTGDSASFQPVRWLAHVRANRMAQRAFNGAFMLVTGLAVIAALGLATLLIVLPRALGLENLVVATGSMSPAFKAGDIALIDDGVRPEDVRLGDVITYYDPKRVVTTHRVVAMEVRDGNLFFLTRGDANNSPDDYLVPADDLLARAEMRLPYLGWVVEFIKQRNVVFAAVLVPAGLIVLNEVFSIGGMLINSRRPAA